MSFLGTVLRLLAAGSKSLRFLTGTTTPSQHIDFIPEFRFVEEPLGLPASTGFGYIDLKFGQRVGPRWSFEILRKLGWGSCASVWLAKDHETGKYVAIKALTSNATELDQQGVIQEVEFTSSITSFIKNAEHKAAYCTQYLSHFTHQDQVILLDEASNHLCLVLELCVSDVDRMRRLSDGIIPSRAVKKVLRDILHGLCQIHALNCTHTDLKLDNFLCRLTDTATHEIVESYLQKEPFALNPPEQSLSGTVQSAKSQPLPPPSFDDLASATFVLSDFGHAQYLESTTADFFTTELYRPPEVIMRGPWGCEMDIWALGCIAYELMCGAPPFVREHGRLPPDYFHIIQMVKFLGEKFPLQILPKYAEAGSFVDVTTGNVFGNPIIPSGILQQRFEALARQRGHSKEDISGCFSVVSKCLRLDPEERVGAFRLLQSEPWLLSLGAPDF